MKKKNIHTNTHTLVKHRPLTNITNKHDSVYSRYNETQNIHTYALTQDTQTK